VDTFSKTRAQREWVDNEYKNAGDYIVWAQGRIAEIDRRSTELEEFRCFSNGLFVRSIKQHQDALGVIRLLKQDVSGYLTGSLAEIKVENVADKLKMYSTLFNQKAMEQFVELASGTDYASGGVSNPLYSRLNYTLKVRMNNSTVPVLVLVVLVVRPPEIPSDSKCTTFSSTSSSNSDSHSPTSNRAKSLLLTSLLTGSEIPRLRKSTLTKKSRRLPRSRRSSGWYQRYH
jgi:hypothetical protein